jgi:hypothetical protein
LGTALLGRLAQAGNSWEPRKNPPVIKRGNGKVDFSSYKPPSSSAISQLAMFDNRRAVFHSQKFGSGRTLFQFEVSHFGSHSTLVAHIQKNAWPMLFSIFGGMSENWEIQSPWPMIHHGRGSKPLMVGGCHAKKGQTATSDIIGIRESNVLVKSALVELMAQQYTLYQKESDDVIPNYIYMYIYIP